MLTEDGCRARRRRLWDEAPAGVEWIVITEPRHLTYFANFTPSPFVFNSQGAAAALLLGRDGAAILIADNVQEAFLEPAFASEKVAPLWYRCVESAGHRTELLVGAMLERLQNCRGNSFGYEASASPAGLFDGLRTACPGVPLTNLDATIRKLRRTKETDEVTAIRRSLKAATAALVAAMSGLRPGMTEFDAYRLVQRVAGEAAGTHVLIYGD